MRHGCLRRGPRARISIFYVPPCMKSLFANIYDHPTNPLHSGNRQLLRLGFAPHRSGQRHPAVVQLGPAELLPALATLLSLSSLFSLRVFGTMFDVGMAEMMIIGGASILLLGKRACRVVVCLRSRQHSRLMLGTCHRVVGERGQL